MKTLTTLLLTLLVSGSLWAVDLDAACRDGVNTPKCQSALDLVFGKETTKEDKNPLANSTRYKPRTAPEPALCSETSSLKNIREYCSKKKVVSNVNNSSTSIASDLQTEVNQEEVTKEKSFFSKLLEAVVIGAVEGAVHNAISEDCEIETKAKSRQVIPGSPQYGNKVTITTTSKNCN